MASDTGFPVLAVFVGLLGPLVNLLTGAVALAAGNQRGYLREGFLHGMLLGPLGLLTVRLLKRRARATEAIQREIGTLGRDRFHILFFSALVLFYAFLGLVYAWLAIRLSQGQDGPELLWAFAGGALLLGYAAFSYACPPLRWLPVLGDWEQYLDRPEFAQWLRYRYRQYELGQAEQRQERWAALGALAALLGAVPLAWALIDQSAARAPWLALGGVLLAAVGIALSLNRRQAALAAGLRLDADAVEHADEDPSWHSAIPSELKHAAMAVQQRRSQTARQLLLRRSRITHLDGVCVACFGLAIWAFAAADHAAVAICGGVLLALSVAALILHALWQKALEPLQALHQEQAAEFMRLAARINRLIEEYDQLRSVEELAFRHEKIPETLLWREIQYKRDLRLTGAESAAGELALTRFHPLPAPPPAAPDASAPAGELLRYLRLQRYASYALSAALVLGLIAVQLNDDAGGVVAAGAFWGGCIAAALAGWALRWQARQGSGAQAAKRAAAARQALLLEGGKSEQALFVELRNCNHRVATRFTASFVLLFPALVYAAAQLAQLLVLASGADRRALLLSAGWLACAVPLGAWLWLSARRDRRRACEIEAVLQPTPQQRRLTIQLGHFNRCLISQSNRLRLLWTAGLLAANLALFSTARLAGLNPGPFSPAVALALALGLAIAAGWLLLSLRRLQRRQELWKRRVVDSLRELRRERYRKASSLRARAMVRERHDGYEVEYEPGALTEDVIESWTELDFKDFGKPERLSVILDRARSGAFNLALLGCFAMNALTGNARWDGLSNGLFLASLALALAAGGLWLAQRIRARLAQQA